MIQGLQFFIFSDHKKGNKHCLYEWHMSMYKIGAEDNYTALGS